MCDVCVMYSDVCVMYSGAEKPATLTDKDVTSDTCQLAPVCS